MDCDNARSLLERGFIERDLNIDDRLRAHLERCAACQRAHAMLHEAEVGLTGDPQRVLSPSEWERMLSAVLPAPLLRRRSVWLRLSAAAATTLLAVVAMGVLLTRSNLQPEEFIARGQGNMHRSASAPVGIRPLCITEGAVRSLGGPAERRCQAGDSLGFTYRNETGRPFFLQLVVVTGQASRRLPVGETLVPTVDEAPLRAHLQLGAADVGPAVIHGLLSSHRQPDGTLLAALQQGAAALRALARPGESHLVRLETAIGER